MSSAPPPAAAPKPPIRPERVLAWFAGAVGAFFLLVAVLLGLKVAIERGWLGPQARVAGGALLGIALWGLGGLLRKRAPYVASTLAGTGVGAVFAAIYAGTSLYALWPPPVGVVLMALAVAGAMVHALVTQDRVIAHIALFGGVLAPVFIPLAREPLPFFAYLVLLSGGATLLAARARWPLLVVANAGWLALLSVGWLAQPEARDSVYGLAGTWSLSVPFLIAAGVGLARRGREELDAHSVELAFALSGSLLPGLVGVWVASPTTTSANDLLKVLAVALLAVPAWSLARLYARPGLALLGTAMFGGSCVAFPLSTLLSDLPPESVAALWSTAGLLGAGLVTLIHLENRDAWWGTDGAILGAGVACLAGSIAAEGPTESWLVCSGLLVALGLAGWRAGSALRLFAAFVSAGAIGVAVVLHDGFFDGGLALGGGAALLVVSTFVPILLPWDRHEVLGRASGLLATAAFGLAVILGWANLWGYEHLGGAVALLVAVLGAAAAVLVRFRDQELNGPVVGAYLLAVVVGLQVVAGLELEREWLTIALAVQMVALIALPAWKPAPWLGFALGVVVGLRLLLNPFALGYHDASGPPLVNWTLWTWGLPAAAAGAASVLFARTGTGGRVARRVGSALLLVLCLLLTFMLINMELSHAFTSEGPVKLMTDELLPRMLRSLSWAAYGIALIVGGIAASNRLLRGMGFGFLMLGAGKVFALDLWSLAGWVRVGSVFGLGVSLLVAAFLFERLVLRGLRTPDEEAQAVPEEAT